MTALIIFAGGFFLGVFTGMIVMSSLAMGRRDDE